MVATPITPPTRAAVQPETTNHQGQEEHPQGPLCGKCAPGHGEALECLAVAWLMPAAVTVGVAYAVLVVWLPINHHPLWKSIAYFVQSCAWRTGNVFYCPLEYMAILPVLLRASPASSNHSTTRNRTLQA